LPIAHTTPTGDRRVAERAPAAARAPPEEGDVDRRIRADDFAFIARPSASVTVIRSAFSVVRE
jgi:hypothetical protein